MVFGPTMPLKLLCIIRLAPYPNRSSSTDFVDEPYFNSLGSNSPQLAADLKRDSSAFSLRMTLGCHAEPFGPERASRTGSAKGKLLPSDIP